MNAGRALWSLADSQVSIETADEFRAVAARPELPVPLRRRLVRAVTGTTGLDARDAALLLLKRTDMDLADLAVIQDLVPARRDVLTAVLTHPAAEPTLVVDLADRAVVSDNVMLREFLTDLPDELAELSLWAQALVLLIYEAGMLDDAVERYAAQLATAGAETLETARMLAEEMTYPYFVFAAAGVHA